MKGIQYQKVNQILPSNIPNERNKSLKCRSILVPITTEKIKSGTV